MKAHLNPFAPDRVQRLLPFDPELIETTWEQLETRWENLHRRAVITGPHGSGKTTFLNTFAERLADTYHVETLFFHRDEHRLSPQQRKQITRLKAPSRTILLVDGEGHLTLRERHWLRHQSQEMAGYLVARHHRCTLPTLLSLSVTPKLAHQLLEQIHPAEATRRANDLPQLLRKKSGNLRELWLSFYDNYASQDSPPSSVPPNPDLQRSQARSR
ncbi:MAG: hypothetical protein ACSHYB_18240 [Roseibacillus sp.]